MDPSLARRLRHRSAGQARITRARSGCLTGKAGPAALVAMALILAGCANPTEKDEVDDMVGASRPTMEQVLAQYEQMQADMFAALGSELGPKRWGRAPNDDIGPVRSSCGTEIDGEVVNLVIQSFDGTYDPDDWHRAADIVRDVGERHGFTDTGTVVDRPDDIEIYGGDENGGRYVFGMAVNTILTITTGCHRWESTPAAEDERTEPER